MVKYEVYGYLRGHMELSLNTPLVPISCVLQQVLLTPKDLVFSPVKGADVRIARNSASKNP